MPAINPVKDWTKFGLIQQSEARETISREDTVLSALVPLCMGSGTSLSQAWAKMATDDDGDDDGYDYDYDDYDYDDYD